MACYIFGAGSFYGLTARPQAGDFTIAADGGWLACRKTEVIPDLLLGDFDSLSAQPDFPNILRVPVEKDDTDTMLAVKTGHGRPPDGSHRCQFPGAIVSGPPGCTGLAVWPG